MNELLIHQIRLTNFQTSSIKKKFAVHFNPGPLTLHTPRYSLLKTDNKHHNNTCTCVWSSWVIRKYKDNSKFKHQLNNIRAIDSPVKLIYRLNCKISTCIEMPPSSITSEPSALINALENWTPRARCKFTRRTDIGWNRLTGNKLFKNFLVVWVKWESAGRVERGVR